MRSTLAASSVTTECTCITASCLLHAADDGGLV